LTKESFSELQWKKRAVTSTCISCEQGAEGLLNRDFAYSLDVPLTTTARYNKATQAEYDEIAFKNPFAEGECRWVAKGFYTEGGRKGQTCVCKWFKTKGDREEVESTFFDVDLEASSEAIRIVQLWNKECRINRIIRVNVPEVWTVLSEGSMMTGKLVLQEPFISNYEKFNSNSGWANDKYPWARVMQALSHYSYHISNGQRLLCDLQGGVYDHCVILTDPAIMSPNKQYGPTDLGLEGIDNFFAHHVCNEFCSSRWKKPRSNTTSCCSPLSNKRKRRRCGTGMEIESGEKRTLPMEHK
jgi:hypothetical protein